jgi:hypothetical protein
MTTKNIAAAAILLSAIPATAGTTVPSLASPEPVVSTEPAWHCRVALYGWAETLDGDVTLHGRNVPVDASFSDILDHLDYAVMGAVEVGYGRWSFLSDLMLSQISGSADTRNTQIDTQLQQFVGNFVVAYNVIDSGPTCFDVYAGVRVNSMDVDLDIHTQNLGTLGDSGSKTWVDPVIGARFQQNLTEKFFFRAAGDIGGFGVSSDFTWQALAAFGYRVCDGGSLVLGYRGIGTDYTDGNFGYDVITHGVLLGFEYRF